MKKIFLYIFLILISVSSFADTIPIPELKSPVTDLTGTLSENEIDLLEQKLESFESDSTAQIAVLIISSKGEETIEEYSMRLAEEWKIGFEGKDNGIIIIVAKDDREIRIEIGYGLEQYITDSDASGIIDDEITPYFKSGNFYSGINSGIDKLIFLINNEGNNLEYKETVFEETKINKKHELGQKKWYVVFIIILIFAKFLPPFFSRSKLWILITVIIVLLSCDLWLGYKAEDMELAWMYMIITGVISFIPLLINIFNISPATSTNGSYSSYKSHSSSSSSSSWSSNSSSSGSSYSGGGGSFGGGGASGSW